MTDVAMGFQPEVVLLPLDRILPMRQLNASVRAGSAYQRLAASIREVGIIEPLAVFPQPLAPNGVQDYMLLDGHARLDVLRELGQTETLCLIARDDEGFTYNHRVNQMPPIQEHFMILRALKKGVSEERIAATLNVNVSVIRKKRDLLDGICGEAVDLLRERAVPTSTVRELKKVVALRQIEVAELMCAANNYSVGYVRCLVAATPPQARTTPLKPADTKGLTADDLSRIEREMTTQGQELRLLEESQGRTTLNLVLAAAYLRRLVGNQAMARFLAHRYPEILAEFQKLAENADLQTGG